jgi:hypothetical protein
MPSCGADGTPAREVHAAREGDGRDAESAGRVQRTGVVADEEVRHAEEREELHHPGPAAGHDRPLPGPPGDTPAELGLTGAAVDDDTHPLFIHEPAAEVAEAPPGPALLHPIDIVPRAGMNRNDRLVVPHTGLLQKGAGEGDLYLVELDGWLRDLRPGTEQADEPVPVVDHVRAALVGNHGHVEEELPPRAGEPHRPRGTREKGQEGGTHRVIAHEVDDSVVTTVPQPAEEQGSFHRPSRPVDIPQKNPIHGEVPAHEIRGGLLHDEDVDRRPGQGSFQVPHRRKRENHVADALHRKDEENAGWFPLGSPGFGAPARRSEDGGLQNGNQRGTEFHVVRQVSGGSGHGRRRRHSVRSEPAISISISW